MKIDFNERDAEIYEKELKEFLPEKIFDSHIHLLDDTSFALGYKFPDKNCYLKFGGKFTLETCMAYFKKLLPEQEIYINSFGSPDRDTILDAAAKYTGKVSDNENYFGMALVSPHDNIEDIKRRIIENKLVGYKPYLNFVDWKDTKDITIFDMLPEEQMEYANSEKLVITLHIPRPGRLADPVNQKDMVSICKKYPDAKIIFAHIGRAYYLSNVVGFLQNIADLPNAYIDTAMINHEGVLEYVFKNFPVGKILFGSDAPIALLRGKSVEINNQYAYLMAEDYRIGTAIYDSENAVDFTFFFYEQLRGIKLATERTGLSTSQVEDIFFNNSYKLFSNIAKRYK